MFTRALNDIDIDITDYRYDDATHQLFLKRALASHEYELPFTQESDGTRKLIAALPVILLALREGRLMIVDELADKLHPKLLRYVIALFKNKEINKNGAQPKMIPTKAKSILSMKSEARITTASRIQPLMTSNIWKDDMVPIHIYPICWEMTSHESKAT